MALLRVEDVHARYGPITAIDGVGLAIEEGETVAIVGPNGAGKTTLLSTIAGTVTPYAGAIEFEGASIAGRRPEEIVRRGISLVPERRRILGTLTVRENLQLGGSCRGLSRSAVRQARRDAETVVEHFPELAKHLDARAMRLSGGEQQMLAIGRALVAAPRVMLLDEPSLGLAPIVVERVFAILDELRQSRQVTMLLVEQNAIQAIEFADRTCVLRGGRIVFEGDREQLLAKPDLAATYLGYHVEGELA